MKLKQTIFSTTTQQQVKLEVSKPTSDSIQISLFNLNYETDKSRIINRSVFLIGLIALIIIFMLGNDRTVSGIWKINFPFVALLIYELYSLKCLIKYEELLMVENFAVQSSTQYTIGRDNFFLPLSQIHDFVINETILHLNVVYLLLILTKNDSYQKTPIIPVMNKLNANCDCLQIIYNLLQDKLFC